MIHEYRQLLKDTLKDKIGSLVEKKIPNKSQFQEMHWLCELTSRSSSAWNATYSPGRTLGSFLVLRDGLLVKVTMGTLEEL